MGHEARIITVPMFREMVEGAGVPFTSIGHEEEFHSVLQDPALWRPLVGPKRVFHHAMRALPWYYEAIVSAIRGSETVIVSPFHKFAAQVARKKFGVPLVMVHLQPACFLSAWEMPLFVNGMEWLDRLPRWLKRFVLTTANPVNGLVRARLNPFCREIGVKPPTRPVPEWLHSPDANLALFPEWFAAPQPDWPANVRLTGFPLEDLKDQIALPGELAAFVAAGSPPVLFAPGTGNAQSHKFFEAGLRACEELNLRVLFSARFRETLPSPLPGWALAFDYAPFSVLLPRVAAIVHHGGIGTMSQAFAAGVPQLVMPMSHDQPDNAARMKRLGCGRVITPRRFTAVNVARELRNLLDDEDVKTKCAGIAVRCSRESPASIATEALLSVIPPARTV